MKIVVLASEFHFDPAVPVGVFDTRALAEKTINAIGSDDPREPEQFGCDIIRSIDSQTSYYFTFYEVQENVINLE